MENEVWKPVVIKGFEDYYEVSDMGNVRSLPRHNQNKIMLLKPKVLKRGGYLAVTLKLSGSRKTARLNRLVALSHIPNPNNYPEVNHTKGDKKDNRAAMLEWCTKSQNIKHAYAIGINKGNKQYTSKPVTVFSLSGEKIHEFASIHDAGRKLNIHNQNICAVLKGLYKQAGGYVFKYST